MMPVRSFLLCATVLLVPVSAAAQTASVPPSATPPPAKTSKSDQEMTALKALDLTTTVTTAKFNGAVAAMPGSARNLNVRRDVRSFNNKLNAASNVLAAVNLGEKGYEVGTEIYEGNYANAARKGAAATIDTCIDVAINALCRAGTIAAGGVTSVYTSPFCVAAVQIGKTCVEKWLGGTLGELAVEAAESKFGSQDGDEDGFGRDMALARSSSASRLASMRSTNEDALAEQARQRSGAPLSTTGADESALFGSFLQGLNSALVPTRTAPMTPASTPSGCHPGHDEAAHPGGCHDPRGGAAR